MSSVKSTSAEAKAKGGGKSPGNGKAARGEQRRETRAGKGAGAEEKGSVYREVETSGGRRATAIFEVEDVYLHIPTELSAAGFELKIAGTVMVTDRVSALHVCMCACRCAHVRASRNGTASSDLLPVCLHVTDWSVDHALSDSVMRLQT